MLHFRVIEPNALPIKDRWAVCKCKLHYGKSIRAGFLSVSAKGLCQWTSYQIRKIGGCACAGNAGNVFPATDFQRKPLVSDPDMHHGTCVTHVPWCMSGSLTRNGGENVPDIPGACATHNFTYLVRDPWEKTLCIKSYLIGWDLV